MTSLSSMSRSPEITVLSLVMIMRSTNWGPRCFSTQRYCEVGTGSVGQDGPLNSGPVGVREGLQLVRDTPSTPPPNFLCFCWGGLFFWLGHAACGISVARPGTEPALLNWEHRVLTSGLPGSPPMASFNKSELRKLFAPGALGHAPSRPHSGRTSSEGWCR